MRRPAVATWFRLEMCSFEEKCEKKLYNPPSSERAGIGLLFGKADAYAKLDRQYHGNVLCMCSARVGYGLSCKTCY